MDFQGKEHGVVLRCLGRRKGVMKYKQRWSSDGIRAELDL